MFVINKRFDLVFTLIATSKTDSYFPTAIGNIMMNCVFAGFTLNIHYHFVRDFAAQNMEQKMDTRDKVKPKIVCQHRERFAKSIQ